MIRGIGGSEMGEAGRREFIRIGVAGLLGALLRLFRASGHRDRRIQGVDE